MTPLRREARRVAALALPVVGTQLGSMMLGVVDIVMLGHYSAEALASASNARGWLMGTLIIAHGFLLGLDPVISQAHGAGEGRRLGEAFQRGIVLALLLSLPMAALWLFTEDILLVLTVPPELAGPAHDYSLARIPGIPAFLLFMVMRSWLQGREIMRPAMWVVLAANAFNVLANWALIFGHLGFPRLGLVGAGYATTASQFFMAIGLFVFIRAFRLQRAAWFGWTSGAWRGMGEILRFGTPVALQLGVEIWAFHIATLMSNHFGTVGVASHSIVLNLASISFMVPLGIAIGTSTRVGNLIGAGRLDDAQRSANVSLVLGAGVMVVFAVLFILGRDWLPMLYNTDPEVLALSAALLPIAAAFQLFDGTQVVGAGVLRGMGRTRPLAAIHFVGFYVLGLPVAWWLAFRLDQEVVGIWWGLCLGLGVVAAAMVLWVLRWGPATAVPVVHHEAPE